MDQLAIIQGQLHHLNNWKQQLLDQLSEADENGLLNDYRNVSNSNQIVWDEMTITKATRITKTYDDDVKEAVKRIEEEATRLGKWTKTRKEYWTLRTNNQ